MAVKVQHVDLAKHQCSISQTLRQFWLDGEICDVVVKSSDGTEHPAHTAVLCATSKVIKNLLKGSFAEADQVRKGEPVEIAASEPVVGALLEYIYGGQPELPVDHSMELLRLADAYDLPDLAAAIEAGLRSTLDEAPVATALNILKQSQGLHDLKSWSEKKVALHFEACLEEAAFFDLSEFQLGRILRREDLKVSREDMVFNGIFKWFKSAKSMRDIALTWLLQHIDFQAISSGNLTRISNFASTLGPRGDDLQRDVHEALEAQRNQDLAATPDEFRPKRRCLKYVSPYLGASSSEASGQQVLPQWYHSLCWHGDALYGTMLLSQSIYRWRPGEDDAQVVAGNGAQVAGVNDLGDQLTVAVSPDGRIIVADCSNKRLVSFHNGFGQVLADGIEGLVNVFCAPTGVVYALSQGGKAVQKLVGDSLHLVIDSESLPEDQKFEARFFFATREEVLYLSDKSCKCVLRVKLGEQNAVAVDVVGDVLGNDTTPAGLFATDDGKIYVAGLGQGTVLVLHPGDSTWTEVIKCPPDQLQPFDVVVHDGSLYVSMVLKCVYKYDLPPELDLK